MAKYIENGSSQSFVDISRDPVARSIQAVDRVVEQESPKIRENVGFAIEFLRKNGLGVPDKVDVHLITPNPIGNLMHLMQYVPDLPDQPGNELYAVRRTVSITDNDNGKIVPLPRNAQTDQIIRRATPSEWIKYGRKIVPAVIKASMEKNQNGKNP